MANPEREERKKLTISIHSRDLRELKDLAEAVGASVAEVIIKSLRIGVWQMKQDQEEAKGKIRSKENILAYHHEIDIKEIEVRDN
jgi:hypothetical protein